MASVGMGIFLSTIDGSIVNVALPSLVKSLNTNFATVQWVVLAYLLTLATVILSMGRLGDMLGKKPVYTVGFVIFTLGSVLCGISPTIYTLIAFRILQALGASMVMALGTAILTEAFPPSERGMALGLAGALVSVGIVIGPTLGGLLLEILSWHWIFFVNLPIGIIGILMVLRFVPNIRAESKEKFDFLGAGTLFVALISLLLALSIGQNAGFGDIRVLALFVTSAIFLPLFVAVENRVSDPMIDMRLFLNRLFSVNLVTASLSFICTAGTTLLIPFFLEGVLSYNPAKVGLLMAVVPVSMGLLAPIAGSLSDRFGTGIDADRVWCHLRHEHAGFVVGLPASLHPTWVGTGDFQLPQQQCHHGLGSSPSSGRSLWIDGHHSHFRPDHRDRCSWGSVGYTRPRLRRVVSGCGAFLCLT
jgi:EmrB/QacA subfamily drug resistance transporter